MTATYFEFRAEQEIPMPRDELFPFFSEARNLERITPPWLRFRIAHDAPIGMHEGCEIEYRLRIRGLPVTWRSRITVWEPPFRFVDEQLQGPYKEWIHEHRFLDEGDRTAVHDHVRYRLPLGPLAPLLNRLLVRRDIETIFAYRKPAILRELGLVREQSAS